MVYDDSNLEEFSCGKAVFCETGSPLALNLIQVSSRATESFGIIELDVMKRAIDDAFEALRVHWLTCPRCIEDETSETI
jgi:hypothetical protein